MMHFLMLRALKYVFFMFSTTYVSVCLIGLLFVNGKPCSISLICPHAFIAKLIDVFFRKFVTASCDDLDALEE